MYYNSFVVVAAAAVGMSSGCLNGVLCLDKGYREVVGNKREVAECDWSLKA